MKHYAGHYYPVYNRGVNRQPIFSTEENYHFRLRQIKQYLPSYSIHIVAYALMPNHYHFLIAVDQDDALSPFFQRLFNSYSQTFNRQQNRSGTLFESRAKSILIDDSSDAYAIARYIHLNPVVAGLTSLPEDWEFSNYLEWIGVRKSDLFDSNFRELFFSSPEEYKQYVISDIPQSIERKLEKYYFD